MYAPIARGMLLARVFLASCVCMYTWAPDVFVLDEVKFYGFIVDLCNGANSRDTDGANFCKWNILIDSFS